MPPASTPPSPQEWSASEHGGDRRAFGARPRLVRWLTRIGRALVARVVVAALVLGVSGCDATARPISSTGPSAQVGAPGSAPSSVAPTGPQASSTGPTSPTAEAAPSSARACGHPLSVAARAERLEWVHGRLEAAVASFEKQWFDGRGGLVCPSDQRRSKGSIHDWGDYALAKFATAGRHPETAALVEAALRCLMTFQSGESAGDAEPGVFPFHYGDPMNPRDNPTEFALAPLANLLLADAPSPSLRAELEPHLVAGLRAIERHEVCPRYTNICLLQTAEMVSLGRFLAGSGEATVRDFARTSVESGKARLDDWLAFTRASGVSEFDSPTYYEMDLVALLLALHGSDDDAVRAKLRAALDYFWTDVGANYFAGRGSLAGPQSRTYSFFAGQGALSLAYYLQGLRAQPPEPADLNAGLLFIALEWLNAQENLYAPPERALCLAAESERAIVSTFGPDRRQRSAFITPDFALGGASDDYGTNVDSNQDETIRAELASTPTTSAIVVLPDYLDSPGVAVKSGDFKKITHLLMSPAVAQARGTMLALLRVRATDPKYRSPDGRALPLVNLATNVVFPADADELLTDGPAFDRTRTVGLGATPSLVVRVGTGAVGVSVIDAGGLECAGPAGTSIEQERATLFLKPLEGGSEVHGPTARLAVYHALDPAAHPASLSRCFARVALLFVGNRCATDGCAKELLARLALANGGATRSYDPRTGDWDVRVSVEGRELRVHRVVGPREDRLLAREVDGHPMSFAPLEVNGQPVVIAP
jgi:hypothetical protein